MDKNQEQAFPTIVERELAQFGWLIRSEQAGEEEIECGGIHAQIGRLGSLTDLAQPDGLPMSETTHVKLQQQDEAAARLMCSRLSSTQGMMPEIDGLLWYFENGVPEPRPVLLNQARWEKKFKSFDGAEQSWLRDGEYLVGPQPTSAAQ